MSIANGRTESLLQSQFRAIQVSTAHLEPQDDSNPVSQVLTTLMRHGGAYTLLDPEMMAGRMAAILQRTNTTALSAGDISNFVNSVSSKVASFFQHLVNNAYSIPSGLMSHLAFPGKGLTYSDPALEVSDPKQFESPEIPAAFTFVGQFIDHDLTMNAVDLFEPQTGPVQDTASPLIDLDSVYGPRTFLTSPSKKIYNNDGSFKLKDRGGFLDLERDAMGNAFISDKRNDENQFVLQIHLLVMRLHNKLIASGMSLPDAYTETLFNWQSVLLNDYLTRVLDPGTLSFLLTEIDKPNFGAFKYKPLQDLASGALLPSLPHEFAIGFRFGHSQLRPTYVLDPVNPPVKLFDNSLVSTGGAKKNVFSDMRGSQELAADHVIDFNFFAGGAFLGNRIDGKVTSVVFDLPESAIPDDIKYIGNLVHRNLIRSRQVGLCAGEDLADFYGIARVPPAKIDADTSAHDLYKEHGKFRTPLWYYLLKEAELAGGPKSSRLGALGSRLVGEVIVGAIKWAPQSVLNNPGWKSKITGASEVKLLDIVGYV